MAKRWHGVGQAQLLRRYEVREVAEVGGPDRMALTDAQGTGQNLPCHRQAVHEHEVQQGNVLRRRGIQLVLDLASRSPSRGLRLRLPVVRPRGADQLLCQEEY